MKRPGVIFDMDGLLLDTERICLEAFVQTRRAFSLPESPEVYLSCVGLHASACSEIIAQSVREKATLKEFNRAWDARIEAAMRRGIPVKPGALDVLETLSGHGYPVAVATSTRTETAAQRLEASGLLKYIQTVVGGDHVTRPKPDPEAYIAAAASLGYNAEDCIAFEDTDTGVRAAVASGARTVQVPDLVPPSADVIALGHLIVPNLIEGAVSMGLMTD